MAALQIGLSIEQGAQLKFTAKALLFVNL